MVQACKQLIPPVIEPVLQPATRPIAGAIVVTFVIRNEKASEHWIRIIIAGSQGLAGAKRLRARPGVSKDCDYRCEQCVQTRSPIPLLSVIQARLMYSTVFDRERICGQGAAELPEPISFVIFRAPSGYRFRAAGEQVSSKIRSRCKQVCIRGSS